MAAPHRPDRLARVSVRQLLCLDVPRAPGSEVTLGPPTHVARIRSVPDDRFGRDVHVARPDERPVIDVHLAKGGVIERDSLEDAHAIQKRAQVPFDNGAIGERQLNDTAVERPDV